MARPLFAGYPVRRIAKAKCGGSARDSTAPLAL